MKTKIITLILLANICSFSQSLKEGTYRFRYEVLPYFPLDKEIKNYKVKITNVATDGTALDGRKLYFGEKYIPELTNITQVHTKNLGGVFIGNIPNQTLEVINPDAPCDLGLSIEYGNLEIIDKKEQMQAIEATPTAPAGSYWNYKITFNFPYKLKLKDLKKNVMILDTLINIPKTTLFPSNYRMDAFGNFVSFPGHTNKPDLDLDYKNNAKDLYLIAKSYLMGACLGEQKAIFSNCFSYLWSNQLVCPTRVKSKDPLFMVCDTTVTLIEQLTDSIAHNSKKENHLNWHTKSIKTMAAKLSSIWEQMLNGEKYLAAFTDPKDKELYIFRMKKNLVISYLLQDEYAKARTLYDEVWGTYNAKKTLDYNESDFMNLDGMIKREGYMYLHHKTRLGFY
jgi:hypothetical protein